MTPVGGSVIFSSDKNRMTELAEFYPGRASSSPIIDLFCNLLSMGKVGLKDLIKQRKEGWKYMKAGLEKIAKDFDLEMIQTPSCSICLVLGFGGFQKFLQGKKASYIGGLLYSKRVSGIRIC